MEKYISLRITEQIEKEWSILAPRVNLNLFLSTGEPGHARWRYNGVSCIDLRYIFKISLISWNLVHFMETMNAYQTSSTLNDDSDIWHVTPIFHCF